MPTMKKRPASRSGTSASGRSTQEQKYRAAMRIARASVMWVDKYSPYDFLDALEVGESRRSGMNRMVKDQADMILRNKDDLVRTFTEWLPDLDGQAAKDQQSIIIAVMNFRTKYGRSKR